MCMCSYDDMINQEMEACVELTEASDISTGCKLGSDLKCIL